MANGIHTNGNGKSPGRNTFEDIAGLGVAEFTSIVASLGTVAMADVVAPGLMNKATNALSKVIFEPYLNHIEWGLGKVCRLESCKPDREKSKHERAQHLAHATVLFGAAFVPSFIVKVATRRGIKHICMTTAEKDVAKTAGNEWWKLWRADRHDKGIIALDEGVHIGSLLLVNTGTTKTTDKMIDATQSMFESIGFSKKKSGELASMAMIWELPNALGLVAGSAGVYVQHNHPEKWKTFTQKLHLEGKADQNGHTI